MIGSTTLMHKNDKVVDCKFDRRGYLESIGKVYREDLLPLCVESNPTFDLHKWILSRNIAANRKDIAPKREFYGSLPFISSHGLSLLDTYWFSSGDFKDWEKVNPYDNWNCKTDPVYLMLVAPDRLTGEYDTNSPNLVIPGATPRFWYKNTKNELFMLYSDAQKMMNEYRQVTSDMPVADRHYTILAGHIFTRVPAFTSKDVEAVSLDDLYNTVLDPNQSMMKNLEYCCEHYNIPNWQKFLNGMFKFDKAIGNMNRELSDVYVLRDTNTLEFIGFAPL